MSNRRQFISATALLTAAIGATASPKAAAQATVQEPTPATPAAPATGGGATRKSAPGPWSLPAAKPDPSSWQGYKPVRSTGVVAHGEFVLSPESDPLQLFVDWFNAAKEAGEASPDTMTLSTVDDAGMPDSRVLVLHWINEGRFQFSSYETSAKGKQLKRHPKAAMLFYWRKTGQIVRVRGTVQPFTRAQTEELRPIKRATLDLRLHDLVFRQSAVLRSAEELESDLRDAQAKYPEDVPLRDWIGYFLTPLSIEFLRPTTGSISAERMRFSRRRAGMPWLAERLVP